MCTNPLQQKSKYLISFTGYILIPFLFVLPLALMHSLKDNYTGFLEHAGLLAGILLFGVILGWFSFCGIKLLERKADILPYLFSSVLCILIPYQERSLLSTFHLICAFGMFLTLEKILFQILFTEPLLQKFRFLSLLFCLLHTVSSLSVTGLSEAVYGITASLILTRLVLRKR